MKLIKSISISLLLLPVMALALPTDRNKPIEVSADTADIDNKKGISIYRGNVVMIQGTTRITGDTITIYSRKSKVDRMVAVGREKRAYYEEQQANNQGTLQAWGKTIDYSIAGDTIELIRNAELIQKGDTFEGDKIDYNLTLQTVNATGNSTKGSSKGRVKMVIQPKTESN